MLGLLVAAQAAAAACRRSAACRLLPSGPTTLLPVPCRRMGDPALADPDRFALAAVQQYLHEQGFERGARMSRHAASSTPAAAHALAGHCAARLPHPSYNNRPSHVCTALAALEQEAGLRVRDEAPRGSQLLQV